MNDRDCESCKKFSRVDPIESEGYCDAKRTWVDPQEGEDCKMHEFTLWTANKYKDGTPIMSDPEVDINSLYPEAKAAKNSMYGKCASNQLDSLEQRVDELSEEYDAVLKTHGDTLEEHLDRICELENDYANIIEDLCIMKERLCKITSLITDSDKYAHIFENFCGNCTHSKTTDGIYACELSGEIIDPDSASCSMFEPPF